MDLTKKANQIFIAKGKKLVHIDMQKDKISKDELLKLMLGPTGNLRAPVVLKGKKMIIGFNQEIYDKFFAT